MVDASPNPGDTIVVWFSNGAASAAAAQECADIFAGQAARVRAWEGAWGEGMKRGAPDWEIDGG